ncbi:MAG: ClbS/DfsB family four-helix bundle protein [Chloroflexi bacterium]|nr:ClbS/DfsB family four-helix bundle protein [Chloroflexota bacterium]
MAKRDNLLALLARGRANERAFYDDLSAEERAAGGTFENWSPKDLLAHIMAWQKRTLDRILDPGSVPAAPGDDTEHQNVNFYETYRDWSWDDVLAESDRVYEELVSWIQSAPEDALTNSQYFDWLDGQPLWRRIAGDGFSHPLVHLAETYVRRGRADRASQMYEQSVQVANALDDSPEWRSIAIYNLACYYAIAGQKEKAVERLRQALELNPGLTEWSKEDPDFASIRQEPDYQAIYTD